MALDDDAAISPCTVPQLCLMTAAASADNSVRLACRSRLAYTGVSHLTLWDKMVLPPARRFTK
ncbi:hypothetical protein MES5069_220145 [Mesorhizobium escarrei]|uniref:Uncharacterized protein n=1 Tax=Mesorhizobium escarrei TaxID=666018 RepID=A0ABM9DRV2_9HYPH|nr:hypothetical protein MES5069_220145 [Mesorhizobium escarrei]